MQTAHSRPAIAPPVYELSFVSQQSLPPIRCLHTRLRSRANRSRDPIAQLRRLVAQVKERSGIWLTADGESGRDLAIIYPDSPNSSDSSNRLTWEMIAAMFTDITADSNSPIRFEPIESRPIDLREPRYRRLLWQYCNQAFCRCFRNGSPSQVDEIRQRIYSPKNVWTIGNEIEVRRYMTFDFVMDCDESVGSAQLSHISSNTNTSSNTSQATKTAGDRLVLCLDYANEYRSLQTLDQLDPQRPHAAYPPKASFQVKPLKAKQRLKPTYGGKSCEWVDWADVSVGQPLAELGGESLLDYHHRRGHLSAEQRAAINPNDRAVWVRYAQNYAPVHHLPHLLKQIYAPSDLDRQSFDRYILPIDQKAATASQTVSWLNRQGFDIGDRLEFDTTLRQPQTLAAFHTGTRHKNLDFGAISGGRDRRLLVDEVWRGWKQRQLLERPDRIRTQVIYPGEWENERRNYINGLRKVFAEFGIALDRAGELRAYNPLDRDSLHATCQNLPDCDLVFAFVPTRNEPGFDIEINPYNTLKRLLFEQQIPSQMVTYNTARKAARQNALVDGFAQSVVLGIIAKLGYSPWQIHDLPGTAQAFIGLDIGRIGDRGTVAAACIVNDRGTLISWESRCLAGGETIGDSDLRSMLENLIVAFYRSLPAAASGSPPPLRHLVIHRDGTFKNRELETIAAIETELRADGLEQLDLVEIVKDTVVRAAKWNGQQWINPERGFGWRHTAKEAIVMTTGASRRGFASPKMSPQPLLIRQRSGDTDLMTIAEQVYWLSQMQVGSSQVVRLPMTTYFPDRIAEVTLKGLLPPEVCHASRPWFI